MLIWQFRRLKSCQSQTLVKFGQPGAQAIATVGNVGVKMKSLEKSRPGSRWNSSMGTENSTSRLSRLAMNSEFETDSSLSYNSTPNVIKLKLAIRVKPAPQEYSIRSGLPGAAPQIKPAELEVYVEAAKNIPQVNEKAPSTYVRASVHHPKYGHGL